MTGKQQLVGWLGVGLIVANLLDGPLRPVFDLLTGGPATGPGKPGGGGGFTIPMPLPGWNIQLGSAPTGPNPAGLHAANPPTVMA